MPEGDEHVLLELPAAFSHVRLARLVASGIGSAARFDVEEIEDLRIAVDEACGLLIEGGACGRLAVRFEVISGTVQVEVRATVPAAVPDVSVPAAVPVVARPAAAPPVHPDGLAAEILGAVTDSWERADEGETRRVAFRKRRRIAPAEGVT